MIYVARRYCFTATHHVPQLPWPWCETHSHDYTVEVVARAAGVVDVVVDTDRLDRLWSDIASTTDLSALYGGENDLSALYGGENTTVEALAHRWLRYFRDAEPAVYRVVVWEDDSRWGAAE